MTEKIELSVLIKHETDMAYLIDNGGEDIWIPKSQVEYEESEGEDADGKLLLNITIPEWLAIKTGLG